MLLAPSHNVVDGLEHLDGVALGVNGDEIVKLLQLDPQHRTAHVPDGCV